MPEVASREIRNDAAGALRRVQGGEVVTINDDFAALEGVPGFTVIRV